MVNKGTIGEGTKLTVIEEVGCDSISSELSNVSTPLKSSK